MQPFVHDVVPTGTLTDIMDIMTSSESPESSDAARSSDQKLPALDEAAESLSVRYAMNMRPAVERYGAVGRPEDVAAKVRAFYDAGVRHLSLDIVGPYERRGEKLERFAADVRPLLRDIVAAA